MNIFIVVRTDGIMSDVLCYASTFERAIEYIETLINEYKIGYHVFVKRLIDRHPPTISIMIRDFIDMGYVHDYEYVILKQGVIE